ncbi:MAG: RnfABCDGE type electron transport complex subunit D [Planctomycetota bacterium]
MPENLKVSPGPHISKAHSTRSIMIDVIIALIPAVAAAAWYFRFYALIVIGTCVAAAVASECICNLVRKKPNSLGDLSAVVTGLILALSLPPAIPFWAAIIGSAFSIMIGKMVFGGLGANIFNPAMLGRAFMTACFGMLMTTWTVPATLDTRMPIISAATQTAVVTQATPLAWSKQAVKTRNLQDKSRIVKADIANELFEYNLTGQRGGCLGETSALALITGGIYLLLRRTITCHIPIAVLLSAAVFAAIGYLVDPNAFALPWFHLTAGGMLICAFFIATDPVTAPLTTKGMWIFGAGVGALIMLIRIVGEYPEGVMYAVLLMNAVSPLIDRFCKVIPAGGKVNA